MSGGKIEYRFCNISELNSCSILQPCIICFLKGESVRCVMNNRDEIKKLINLLKSYTKTITFIIICLFISVGINMLLPLLTKNIMDKGFIAGDYKELTKLVIITISLYVFNSGIDILKEKKRIDIATKIQYQLTKQSFKHLMNLKIHYFSKSNYAEFFSNISIDINKITSITDENVFFAITQIFSILGGIVGLLIINVKLTLLVLVFIPIKCYISKYFVKQNGKNINEYIKANQEYANWFGNTIGGVREIRLFGIEKYEEKVFAKKQNRIINSQRKISLLSKWNIVTDSVVIEILIMALYIVGGSYVIKQELSVGSIFAFITYVSYVTGPISLMLNIGYFLSGIIPSTKRYYKFMDLEEENYDESLRKPIFESIKFNKVSFGYEENDHVLDNVSFCIPKRSKTVIIGGNGSGKSTIIELLLRMYDVQQGEILMGEKNIKTLNLKNYRELISIVSQEIYLFNDSILNNICLYRNVSEQKLMDTIRDSGLEEFINEKSLNYIVGENGSMLSGGQKQKIAIARALIQDKPILIFDEATSNVDTSSKVIINNLIKNKLREKTVIAITHSSELLKDVDNIILLNENKVKEYSSFNELLEENKDYKFAI